MAAINRLIADPLQTLLSSPAFALSQARDDLGAIPLSADPGAVDPSVFSAMPLSSQAQMPMQLPPQLLLQLSQYLAGGGGAGTQPTAPSHLLPAPLGLPGGQYDDLTVRAGDPEASIEPIPNAPADEPPLSFDGSDPRMQQLSFGGSPTRSYLPEREPSYLGYDQPSVAPGGEDAGLSQFMQDSPDVAPPEDTGGTAAGGDFDPEAIAALMGGGPVPSADYSNIRQPADWNPDELYPSTRRSILQGVLPLIAAAFAGKFGGQGAAAGVMTGAVSANARSNAELRNRAILNHQRDQQRYAREVALENARWARAKDRAATVGSLADRVGKIEDPDVAWQVIQTLKKQYDAVGINAEDAMPGGPTGAYAKTKLAKLAEKKYKDTVASLRAQLGPGVPIDPDKTTASFRGHQIPLSQLAAMADLPTVSADDQLNTATLTAGTLLRTAIRGFEVDHGRGPNAEERLVLEQDALQKFAKYSAKPTDPLARQIQQKRLALLTYQLAQKQAGGSDTDLTNYSPEQKAVAEKINNEYVAASQQFNTLGQAYDRIRDRSTSDLDVVKTLQQLQGPNDPNAKNVAALVQQLSTDPSAKLSPKQREAIVNRAKRFYDGAAAGQLDIYNAAGQRLRDRGIQPADVLKPQGASDDLSVYHTNAPSPADREARAFAGLSQGDRMIVRSMAANTFPIGTRPSKEAMKLLGRASILKGEPIDAAQYQVRLKTMINFTSGTGASGARSIRQAIHHIEQLKQAADALGNTWSEDYNSLSNFLLNKRGSSLVNNFNEAALAVQTELATTFKGGSPTDPEIAHWLEKVQSSDSPEKLRGAINMAIKLMAGRADSLREQYQSGVGSPGSFSILDAPERAILKRFGVDPSSFDPKDNPNAPLLGRDQFLRAGPVGVPEAAPVPSPAAVRSGAARPVAAPAEAAPSTGMGVGFNVPGVPALPRMTQGGTGKVPPGAPPIGSPVQHNGKAYVIRDYDARGKALLEEIPLGQGQ